MVHLNTKVATGLTDVNAWLRELARPKTSNQQLIHQAIALTKQTNQELCLHRGLVMAETLNELGVDDETLAATIVFNAFKQQKICADDIEKHLSAKILKLLNGAMQMSAISELQNISKKTKRKQPKTDNLRKMLLAMVDDVRVVLIKLTEQLCVMRNLQAADESKRQIIAHETQTIYAPLANCLGIGHIKWELEDLAFRYLQPEKYREISKTLKQRRVDRDNFVQQMIDDLTAILDTAGIKNKQITGRAKHIYSIHRKMQRKDVDLNKIYDITALRVLVDSVEDCYTTLSAVHAKWQHINYEFDDYISKPKVNGYRSIHTAIISEDDKHVEIQIRTFAMHQEAELGIAAHWVYKEGRPKASNYESKIAWLRQIMDWQQEVSQQDKITAIFGEHIYVFTPNGDIIELPQGSTPLDFAYHVHSEIGHRCRGAKVNDHIVNLTHTLKTGDRIEIITTKESRPSRDWLNPRLGFVKSSRAKAKVQHWFRAQESATNTADGKNLPEKATKPQNLKNIDINNLAAKLKYKNNQKISDIEVHGVGNLMSRVANCCRPVPGDEIIGYITQGRGISIHRDDCPNIIQAKIRKPERLLLIAWGEKNTKNYAVNIAITATSNPKLAQNISDLFAAEKITIVGLNHNVDKQANRSQFNLTIEISGLNSLSKILNKLTQLPNIISVKRL